MKDKEPYEYIDDPSYLMKIWRQSSTPVLYFSREPGEKIRVKLPYSKDNRVYISKFGSHRTEWDSKHSCWLTPKAWLKALVEGLLDDYGKLYFIQPYRPMEKCAPACWDAQGYDCQCSCLGVNHGGGDPGGAWYVVSEACAVLWGEKRLACRLYTKKENRKDEGKTTCNRVM